MCKSLGNAHKAKLRGLMTVVSMQRAVLLLAILALTSGARAETIAKPAAGPDPTPANRPLQTRLLAEVLRPMDDRTPVATPTSPRSAKEVGQKLVSAGQVKEGEVMFYTLRISNPHAQAVDDAAVVIPVPTNTQVLANSITGAGAQIDCSMDGGTTFVNESDLPKPALSTFGNTVLPCTHLRWRLKSPLPAGAVLLARFRAEFR